MNAINPNFFEELKGGESFLKRLLRFKYPGKSGSKRSRLKRGGEGAHLNEVNPLIGKDYFNSGRKTFHGHLLFFTFLLLASFLVFFARAFKLQVLESKEYQALAQRNRTRTYEIPAPRGVIFDQKGEVIAQNRPTFNLVLNVSRCSLGKDRTLCKRLVSDTLDHLRRGQSFKRTVLGEDSPWKGLSPQRTVPQLTQLDTPGIQSLVIAQNLNKDQLLSLESASLLDSLGTQKVPAIDVLTYPTRDYHYPEAFAHLLGYTGLSNESLTPLIEGKTGLEASYNKPLTGISGQRLIQVNSSNESLREFDTKDPVPGENIKLFADIGLQKLAYEELKKAVDASKNSNTSADPNSPATPENEKIPGATADAGVVVAQDPQTGGVLALASYPSFDAQKMVSGVTSAELATLEETYNHPFFNRAIGANYPPGSTYKMVMASAALEESAITPYSTINDPGYLSVAGYTFRNWKLDGHGQVDLLRALQVSNDTYFYTIGGGYGNIEGLGIDRISNWSKKFGFGAKTGIDIPGEVAGFVPDGDYKDWYLGDTYITSIGQGDFLATPLQVNMVTSYFANGRELLRPRVVSEVAGEATSKEVLARDLISPQTLDLVREGLRRAVTPGGTGYPVFDFPEKYGVVLAGKTGTSEYIDPQGNERTHAWFTVWGPLEDAEIVLTVFLEGGGGGSDDAAPIARTLLDYWFSENRE
ncbi:penicillin-binding protein 2 [candidate division WWE3 bacterium]|nr:penicillin-binding protein 2 [candidate division WWE3 bacterium]